MSKSFDSSRFRMGVGMVLINDDKKIFAGKKNAVNTQMVSWFLKKPWQMPQGGIEDGETPLEAVLRELKEEVGTDNVEVIAETNDWLEYLVPCALRRKGNKVVGQRQKWFLLKFLGDDSAININATSHREFDAWRWMSAGNIIRLSVHFKKRLYMDVFKKFHWYICPNEK
ncbi:MAG: RNA pyrophosphohydrolase [Holosporales bacterium]|jgi:putative (di)nucleoside polyphosphate hydrolase|nr:RNA pyrophosphohydrolase [Holosporales bacterium]